MICKKCGAEFDDSFSFCPMCACPVTEEQTERKADDVITDNSSSLCIEPEKKETGQERIIDSEKGNDTASEKAETDNAIENITENEPEPDGHEQSDASSNNELGCEEQSHTNSNESLEKKENRNIALSRKKTIIAAIVAVAVIAIAITGGIVYKADKAKKAKEAARIAKEEKEKQAQEAARQAQEEYEAAVTNMRGVVAMMYINANMGLGDGIDSCEELINLTNQVWKDAIYKESNKDTKKYVSGAKDFNEALDKLYSSSDVIEFISNMKSATDNLYMDTIPDSLSKEKDAYVKVITAYKDLADWCTWPNGSFSTYMETSQKKYDAFNNAYNEFDVLCPKNESEDDTASEE